jgi:hypothetical protein
MRTEGLKPIATGVLCAALAGCAAWGGEQTVTNKELGYEFELPAHLHVNLNPHGARVHAVLLHHLKEWFDFLSVEVADLKEGETLSSFFKNGENRKKFIGYELIDIQYVKLNDVSGFKLTLLNQPRNLGMAFYYLVDKRRSYSFRTFAMKRAMFDEYASDFDAIVKSFKLLKTE